MSYGSAGISVAAQAFLSIAGTGEAGPTQCGGTAPGKGTPSEGFAATLGRALQENGMVTGGDSSVAGTLPAGLMKQMLEDLKKFQISGDASAASSLLADLTAFLNAVANTAGVDVNELVSSKDGQANLASLLETLTGEAGKMLPTAGVSVAPETTAKAAATLGRALQENGMVTGGDSSVAGTLPAGLMKQMLEDLKKFQISGDASAASSLLADLTAFLNAVANTAGVDVNELVSSKDGQANLASLLDALTDEAGKMLPTAGVSVAPETTAKAAATLGRALQENDVPLGDIRSGAEATLGRALQENGMVTGEDSSVAVTLPAGLMKQMLEDLKKFQISGDASAASSLLADLTAFLNAVANTAGVDVNELVSSKDGQANLASLLKALIDESQAQASGPLAKCVDNEATKGSPGVDVIAQELSAFSGIAATPLAGQAVVTPETSTKGQGTSDDGSKNTIVTVTTTEAVIKNEGTWIPVVPWSPSIPTNQNASVEVPDGLRSNAGHPDGTAQPAVRTDTEALFRKILSAAGTLEKLTGPERQALQLQKEGPSLRSLIAHLSHVAGMSVGEEPTTEGMFTVEPVSGQVSRFTLPFEEDVKLIEIARPGPGSHYGSEAKGENSFGRTDSSGFVTTGVKPGEAAPSSDFGSIVAERIAKIIEQTSLRVTQADTVMRLKVEGAESFLVSIKEQGGRVFVDIRCAESGMASLLRSQKDEIIRHLDEKQVQSTITITSIEDEDLTRREHRERQEQKREQWTARGQQSRQYVQLIV